MIKSSSIKLKPFKSFDISLDKEIHEFDIFYALFPMKKHPMYGKGDTTHLGLFSAFEVEKARLVFPDWENRIVYLTSQTNKKTKIKTVNVYFIHKDAIKSSYNIGDIKCIEINNDYTFNDVELGKNNGTLVVLDNNKNIFFQSNKEKDLYLKENNHIAFSLSNIKYYEVGGHILLDLADIDFRKTSTFINDIKNKGKVINLFIDESSLYHYVNEHNKKQGFAFKDSVDNYHCISTTSFKNGKPDVSEIYVNKTLDQLKSGFKYTAFVNYETPVWLVKKEVDFISFKSEVLFLFNSIEDIKEIPDAVI